MKLFTKGLLIIAIPSVFELLLLGGLVKMQRDASEAEAWSLHSKTVLIEAGNLREPLLLQSARVRNSILIDRPAEVTLPETWSTIDSRIAALIKLVGDNPEQVFSAMAIKDSIEQYHQWINNAKVLLETGRRAELEAQLRLPHGPHRLDQFRTQLAQFIEIERKLDDNRTAEAGEARAWQSRMLVLAVIGSILAAMLAAYIFSRDIGVRLSILRDNARRLADSTPLAARLTGNDEISELDAALHHSAGRLAAAQQSEIRYRAELESRAQELGIVNDYLRQQTQDNEMFIYSVSHDLRSPLVNLQGFSKEISHSVEEAKGLIDKSSMQPTEKTAVLQVIQDDIAVSLRFIQSAVLRSAGIIDAMLRLSRAGRVEYQRNDVDVQDVVQRVIEAMSSTIRAKNVQLSVQTLAPAFGDATAIEQVFGNLIGNAVNYLDPSRDGRIDIGQLEEGRMSLSNDKLNVYFVRDNGLGIPAAHMSKMFSAFQRLHGNVAAGEGVGLALVRRMVERHGGKIWVESTEGVGTTFFVSLPALPTGEPGQSKGTI